jgi:protein TonB
MILYNVIIYHLSKVRGEVPMSDLSLPRSGYANRRSPGALAAAIAVNGGAFALLIAIPAAEVIRFVDPPLRVREIHLPPLPPEAEKPKPQPTHDPAQPVVATPKAPETMTFVEPIIPTGGGMTLGGLPPVGTIEGTTIAPPNDPPRQPSMFVKARLNPRFADNFKPDYPPGLRREGIEGSVTVRVTIDERGRVTAVELIKADDQRFFAETRDQALRYWRFEPARRDGVAVVSDQTMTVHFRLEDD